MMRRNTPCLLAILSSLSLSTAAQQLLLEVGDGSLGAPVSSVWAEVVNDQGEWVLNILLEGVDPEFNGGLLLGDVTNGATTFLQEGTPIPGAPGLVIRGVYAVQIDDEGAIASIAAFAPPGTTLIGPDIPSALFFGPELVLGTGSVTTSPDLTPGSTYDGLEQVKSNERGRHLVDVTVDDPALPGQPYKILLLVELDEQGELVQERVVVREGEVLPGQTTPVANIRDGPFDFALNDLGEALFVVRNEGPSVTNHGIYLGDTLLVRDGDPSPVPGRNWALRTPSVDLNDNRDYVVRAALTGSADGDLLIAKNGVKLVQENDTLPAIAPFRFFDFGSPVSISNSNEVHWWGTWFTDTSSGQGLFVDHELLIQTGSVLPNGVVTLLGPNAVISPNGRYILLRAWVDGVLGVYLLDRGIHAHHELVNGSGANPLCLRGVNPPVLGGAWTVELDTGASPGATASALFGHAAPLDGLTLGIGELLVDVSSQRFFFSTSVASGGVDLLSLPVPAAPTLIGLTAHAQAALAGGGPTRLCNAAAATIGN